MEAKELLVKGILYNFRRIQFLFLVLSLICSVILSNIYLERFSIYEKYILHAKAFKTEMTKSLEEAQKNNDTIKQSNLEARIKRLDNSLKHFHLNKIITFPFIGLQIPADDFNIIASAFLLVFSIWLILPIKQTNSLFIY